MATIDISVATVRSIAWSRAIPIGARSITSWTPESIVAYARTFYFLRQRRWRKLAQELN
jgi:hypothetical protein